MAGPSRSTRQHREHRCGAVERLDLGLLIDAEHHRSFRWVEVEPHDVADFVPFYRLIMFTAIAQHAVVDRVSGTTDVSVGYMSHDIGERVPCRGA